MSRFWQTFSSIESENKALTSLQQICKMESTSLYLKGLQDFEIFDKDSLLYSSLCSNHAIYYAWSWTYLGTQILVKGCFTLELIIRIFIPLNIREFIRIIKIRISSLLPGI